MYAAYSCTVSFSKTLTSPKRSVSSNDVLFEICERINFTFFLRKPIFLTLIGFHIVQTHIDNSDLCRLKYVQGDKRSPNKVTKT